MRISHSQFNLYDTEESLLINGFDHHCLYFNQDEYLVDAHRSLIPFCIRSETQQNSNDGDKSCYGERIKFEKLKSMNISAAELFQWNAVIEIIDSYEKYLSFPDLMNNNEFYCNCSCLSRFGKSCEYEINYVDLGDNERTFTLLFQEKDYLIDDEIKNEFLTSYIGIQCQTNFPYFDWRQICNGVVDCDNGEDEPFELCSQMELNQCNVNTEFRCKTGLCIEKSFGYDQETDCSDQSDQIDIYNIDSTMHLLSQCNLYTKLECDETNYGWKRFPCGNGQFISYSDLTSKEPIPGKTCANGRNLIYLTNLFSSENPNECWKSMICLTGFNYLYSDINCLNEKLEINIKQNCPNEFYFPSNSVIYSFVFFLYEKPHRTNWLNYTGPNYICYNKQYCDKNISILPTILKNNLTCFDVNQRLFSWENFIEYVIYLFSSCYLNISPSFLVSNDKMFYKCNISDRYVSIYRLKDHRQDCFFNEDEDSNINLCLFNTNDHFKCLTNENECIRELFLSDKKNDCSDGTDEYIHDQSLSCTDYQCFMDLSTININEIYRFDELCDNIVNRRLFLTGSNETDETDCQYWPLKCEDSPYTRCNKVWNCQNGLDEIDCATKNFDDMIRNSFNCTSNEHYCIELINDNNDVNVSCISLNRSGDGIIDCIGGIDERLTNICAEKYPIDFDQRFYCMNSSKCIKIDQICDTISDCPLGDDERICSWLFKRNSSKFYCQNSATHPVDRCDPWSADNEDCQLKEQLWFCDLVKDISQHYLYPILYEQYPKNVKSIPLENMISETSILSERRTSSLTNIWICNGGYPIQSLIFNDKFYCLCSPSFYGDYCQYQSERVTVLIKFQLQYDIDFLTVFRLIIYLLNENSVIISHDEILYNRQFDMNDEFDKVLVYLIYERMRNISLHQRSKSKLVRIDSYIIKETDIQYISSWLFHISFPFLPVNRLVVQLLLEDKSFQISKCKKKCGSHGKCMYYVNSNDIEYCWCNQGWFGEKCHFKSSSNLCNETSCAPHSHCFILNDEKQQTKCICPLGKSGNQCYITYNYCENIVCQNNGTCLPLNQQNLAYTCVCQDQYTGKHCEHLQQYWYISIPANISDLSTVPVIIVMSGTVHVLRLETRARLMYKNILLPNTLKMHRSNTHRLAFIRMFHNNTHNFYYMIAIQNTDSIHQLNTSVISQHLCQNVSKLFNETIVYEYSYLKRMKLYHLPCQQNKDLRCFFDEYRICLCTLLHTSDCHSFHHKYNFCDYCKNDGLCVRENPHEQRWNFVCLCPKCSFGRRCQFTSENYFITLDMLIGTEIKRDVFFNQQPFIIYLTLTILILILIISFILNIISIIIFSNKKNRQVGCDLYLLYLTIISQIGLVVVFLRFIFMIIIQIYTIEDDLFIQINCILLEYLLRLVPSLFDWLTVCISIERAYTIIKDVQFTKIVALKTLKISRWIILSVFLLNILSTMHRPFYLILIDDDAATLNNRKPGHPWCVLDFRSTSWNIYEKCINIIHLVVPLVLNSLSILLFLLRKIKFESKTATRKAESSKFFILKEQLLKYQPLLMGTLIVIILEIPRFVSTFALSCIERTWQRYVYLTGYLISFLPLTGILFIYVRPSPKYKKQLQTIMKNKLCLFLSK